MKEDTINLASSALSGLIGKAVCHPIDTCKAKLQSGATFRGLRDLVTHTWQKEGLRGFYQGLGAVLVGGVPGVVVYLSTYENSKKYLSQFSFFESKPFAAYFTSGMLAEVVCCAVFLPVDVVKERLQVQSNRTEAPYRGSVDALRTIIKQEGFRGLYKGYAATVFSYGPFSAIYFVLYEETKKAVSALNNSAGKSKVDLDFSQSLLCSALAGSVASFVTTPLDVAKLRYQIQRNPSSGSSSAGTTVSGNTVAAAAAPPAGEVRFHGLFDALGKIYRAQGLQGLFRGALTRVAYHTPSTALTLASYDQLKILLTKWQP